MFYDPSNGRVCIAVITGVCVYVLRRLIMLWEKRTQLMRETWSAIDSDIGQGDMRTMAREVHRMEVCEYCVKVD